MRNFFLCLVLTINCSCFAQDQEKIYTVVEQMPSFPGGEAELYKFIIDNLNYPDIPEDKLMYNSQTNIRFVITKTGEIKDIQATRPQYESTILTDSLTSIIKRMPRWIPGKHKGKEVNVYFTIPLHVKLKK